MPLLPEHIPHRVYFDEGLKRWFYEFEGAEGGGCDTKEEAIELLLEDFRETYNV